MTAIILTVCVFVVGLALAIVNKQKGIGDTTTFLAILLIPLLVLGVASGKIQEFTGPGGVGAKFQQVARARVDLTSVQRISSDASTQVAKGPTEDFKARLANIVPGAPITFTFKLAGQASSQVPDQAANQTSNQTPSQTTNQTSNQTPSQTSNQTSNHAPTQIYDLATAKNEIKTLLSGNWEVLVIIARSDGTFLAMADPHRFYALLNDPSRGPFLIECLNKGQQPPKYDELVFDSLKDEDTSNAQALGKMLSYNLQIMAVTNKQNVADHIAKREQIVAQLVEQLASQ
jgi:hypothetical protein